jgi:hypothetical protein
MRASLISRVRHGLLLTSLLGMAALGAACTESVFIGGALGDGGGGTGGDEVGSGAGGDRGEEASVPTCDAAVAIAGSTELVCAVVTDGSVWCRGNNYSGQAGNGDLQTFEASFVKAGAPAGAVAAATSGSLTCAVHQDLSVSCWGLNYHGQVGEGVGPGEPDPVSLGALGAGVVQVAVSSHHACALDSQGVVFCWGNSGGGQTGSGAGGDQGSKEATNVSALGSALQVDVGGNRTCVLIEDGTVWCFGNNDEAPIGDGTSTQYNPTPVQAVGLDQVVEIAVGLWNTCARRADGSVWCWGFRLDPFAPTPLAPIPIPGITDAVELDVGRQHLCVRKADGSVWCMEPAQESSPAALTQVAGLPGPAVEISVDDLLSCARLSDSSVWCWGSRRVPKYDDPASFDGQLVFEEVPLPEKQLVPCP